MTRTSATVLIASLLVAAVGCESQPKEDLAAVPPVDEPAYDLPPVAPEPIDYGLETAVAPTEPGTLTVGEAAPGTAPSSAPGSGGSYVVQKRDTLWSIAQRVYGDGQRWQDIARANNISNPKNLRVGQTLALP